VPWSVESKNRMNTQNGLCLTALHDRAFDKGLITIDSSFTVSPELLIQVSDRAHGTHGFNEWLSAYHGKPLKPPQHPNFYPEPAFVQWHVREVFQGKSR
ncbi:MAG: HNH endonuclease, partial [Deltaproteobacteria bacterium]|nr:HNH endonuclease [Deltaproteobacteria bacterium]